MTALVVRPLAEADIDEAFAWYEARSVGLIACAHMSLHPRRWSRRM